MKTQMNIKQKAKLLMTSMLFLLALNLSSSVTVSGPSSACAGGTSGYIYTVGGSPPSNGMVVFNLTWQVNGGTFVVLSPQGQLPATIKVFWNNDPVNGNNTGTVKATVVWATPPSGSDAEFEDDTENVTITGIANAGTLHGPSSVCVNHQATFYVDPIAGADSYQWTIPSGWSWVSTNHTGPSITLLAPSYQASGFNLSVVGKSNSCGLTGSAAASLGLSTVFVPVLNLGSNLSVYVDMPVFQLHANYLGGVWSGKGITREGYFTAAQANLGENVITYSYDNGSCTVTKTMVIIVNPPQYEMTALTFSGNHAVSIPNNNAYSIYTGDFTVETWVRIPPTADGGQILFANSDGDEGYGMVFFTNNKNQLALAIESTAPVLSTTFATDLYDDKCHHLVVTRSGGYVNFFVDGIYYGVSSGSANAGLDISNNVEYTIGYADGYTGGANPLTGTMDELRFWKVARSQAAIQANMNIHISGSTPGLIGYWDFNEGGVVVHDVSSIANHGVLGFTAFPPVGSYGAPTRVQFACYSNGEVGLHYDGSTKFATLPTNTAYNFGNGPFSLEVWAAIDVCNSCIKDQVLLSNKTNNNPNSGFVFYVRNGTNLVIEFPNGGNPCTFVSDPFPYGLNIFAEDNGSCENFGVVRDASGNVTFYFSGMALQGNGTSCAANVNTSENIFVGHHDISSDNHAEFKGNITEVRLWNTNRSSSEISSNQSSVFNSSSSGWSNLVGYYRIKESMGSQILIDNSTVANTGYLGNNSNPESVDPLRTWDWCYPVNDRLAHNTDAVPQSNSNNEIFNDKNMSVYPNPFTNNLTINIKDNSGQKFDVEVFDALNRAVLSKTIDANTTYLICDDLTPGLYLLKITDSNKQSKTYKLIKSNQ